MSEKMHFGEIKNVLILGGSGGIGNALLKGLSAHLPEAHFYCPTRSEADVSVLSRCNFFLINDLSERSLQEAIDSFAVPQFDLIINAIGCLETSLGGPEKSVRDFSIEKFVESFQVNTLVTPMLAKILRPTIATKPFVFVTLSAMVGSIGENEVGGWYSYRASKAALNMIVKTLSIEFGRTNKKSLFLAIHPGTTQTKLSEKFSSRVTHKIHSPEESAENIIDIIFSTPFHQSGSFMNWDKRIISW